MLPAILYLLAFGLIVFLFPVTLVVMSKILAPSHPNPTKESTYECGEVPIGKGRQRLVIQYWSYAIVFVIFDVFVTFFLLSAKALHERVIGAPMPLLIFLGIFVMALFYSWEALVERTL